jgi:hypothetical protein
MLSTNINGLGLVLASDNGRAGKVDFYVWGLFFLALFHFLFTFLL